MLVYVETKKREAAHDFIGFIVTARSPIFPPVVGKTAFPGELGESVVLLEAESRGLALKFTEV
jgi:hypothetical protein